MSKPARQRRIPCSMQRTAWSISSTSVDLTSHAQNDLPSNIDGCKKVAYCKHHAEDSIWSTSTAISALPTRFSRRPSFHVAGSKIYRYRKKTCKERYDVSRRPCALASCSVRPFSNKGSKTSMTYCTTHDKDDACYDRVLHISAEKVSE